MSAPSMVRGQASNFFGASQLPVLEEIFWSTYELHPSVRDRVFRKRTHDRDIWQATEWHDMDLFSETAEGAEVTFKRPKQGAAKTMTVKKFTLGFSISEEMMEDGKYDFVADALRKMGRSARESQEISGMNIFNNGFSSELANDGLSVFNSAHTLPSGGTYSNVLASAADLSQTSLQQAIYNFETNFVGDTGIIERIRPRVLLVNPINRLYAHELLGSELKADTADNNLNSLKGEGLIVMSSPHLTDQDAWFLLAAPEDTGLTVVERKALSTSADMAGGFATDSMRYKAKYREVVGVTIPKGIFGTPGAA